MSFKELKLSSEILKTVEEKGYTEASPIQKKAIPLILEGHDLLAGAQTGTGKTAAFSLPILDRMYSSKGTGEKRKIRSLILTPTRELAVQVTDNVRDYGANLHFKTETIFGGANINVQKSKLRRGIDIVVATPGRLLDHLQQKTINLRDVEIFVLDEADRMLDMGFIKDIEKIIKYLPKERQTLLFSATFPKEIKALANNLLNNPKEVQIAERNAVADKVSQCVYPVDKERKAALLGHSIKEENWYQVLVFTRTKRGADKLTKVLNSHDIKADAFHGNKSQGARTKALDNFKAEKTQVLVATDIAARGIDINLLPQVVNYDLPYLPEDYIHRIGRTARAGQEGRAISLVSADEVKMLHAIEKLLKFTLPRTIIEGFEPTHELQSAPSKPKSNKRKRPNKNRSFDSQKKKNWKPRSSNQKGQSNTRRKNKD
jgi:ATP-dependent RNA helicase RhlE|tara:strand:- start:1593 stop:2882 length:1290 start_codon:yes stop_codon:yes gene_type:complete